MEVDLEVVDPEDWLSSTPSNNSTSSGGNLIGGVNNNTGDYDPSYPTIHFTGSSRGVHSGTSNIKGTVRKMRDGAIRWNFVSTVCFKFLTLLSSPLSPHRASSPSAT